MKKFCISFLIIGIIIFVIISGVKTESNNVEYLRIHIRANSNSEIDQSVKYEVKNLTVDYLTPYIANCTTKVEAEQLLLSKKGIIEDKIDNLLKRKGFNYTSNLQVRNELFPTRVYEDFTLEEGFYDAVIISLGDAKGDNWWCVVYPPLCFSNSNCDVKYKSKIMEIIHNFKSKSTFNS
jgi:stage II sporulation protein R